MLIIPLVKIN